MAEAAVFTLLARAGRAKGDGLPKGATGAALLLYVAARDEASAARDAAAILKDAGLAVLEIEGLGSRAERETAGETFEPEDIALMERAAAENAVIVALMEPEYGEGEA